MHDITELDRRGIPGIAVVTEAFRDGAAAQTKALGLNAGIHWVSHPIQNRTEEELERLAKASIEGILALIIEQS